MKHLIVCTIHAKSIRMIFSIVLLLFIAAGCDKENNDSDSPTPPETTVTAIISGLPGLMGIEADDEGNIWVTESGTADPDENNDTHNNNGKVVVITPTGEKYDAITHLSSYSNVHSQELQGTVHLLLTGKILYILSGDSLYSADISTFRPGDEAMDARTLSAEDIATPISGVPSENNPEQDSHPYNMTIGPDGDLYIVDAGANAIIHRSGADQYAVFAEIPPAENPMFPDLGGPTVQSVPTSISYDPGKKAFFVTTLTGFPFPSGEAVIYQVSMEKEVSVFQGGFSMLVDQSTGGDFSDHIVVQFASSFDPAGGYAPNSGQLIWNNKTENKILADNINQPVGVKQIDDHTCYVTSLGDGSVLKVSF